MKVAAFSVALATLPTYAAAHVARATRSVDVSPDGWTPKPTTPPYYRNPIARSPMLVDRALASSGVQPYFVAPDRTCGYVSGRPGAAYTCGVGGTCNLVPPSFTQSESVPGFVACCNSIACNARAQCLDYDAISSSSACDDGCEADAYTLKCSDTSFRYCNTIVFMRNITDYFCDTIQFTAIQYASTDFPDDQTPHTYKTLYGNGGSSSLSIDNQNTVGASVSVSSTSSAASTSSTSSNSSGGKSSTPVGPIVGGVVGGVAAIVIVAFALWLFLRKRNRGPEGQNLVTPQSQPPMMQQQQSYQGSPPPGQQGSFVTDPYDPSKQYNQYPPTGYYNQYPSTAPGSDPRTSYLSANTSPQQFSGQQMPTQQNPIQEAPSVPSETHRGGVHELS